MGVLYLISLRCFDDTYYRFVMAEYGLGTLEPLRKLAHDKGFRLDMERLDSVEAAERFLSQLETAT